MRISTSLLLLIFSFIVAGCFGSDPEPAIDLYQYPGIDADDRTVIDPDDFELEYRFDCTPPSCTTECALQNSDDWFDCVSPHRIDERSERLDIEEGYLRFEVRTNFEDEAPSTPARADTLILYDFDFELDGVGEYEPNSEDSPFSFPGEYTASCSREDCELSCYWDHLDFDEAQETDCSLDEPFELEFPDEDIDSALFLVEACATDFGGSQNDTHCMGPKTYLIFAPPPEFISIDAGAHHSCAIVEDQSLWCWGLNNAGQLGVDAPETEFAVAERVATDRDWQMVSAGDEHTCAIDDGGGLYCWGDNSRGQLGFSPENPRQPQQVDEGHTGPWDTVSAGGSHTCAITADSGELYCWGSNADGQLGVEDAPSDSEMQLVILPEDAEDRWIDVSAGDEHTCAIAERQGSGTALFCWGNQSRGRLGNNETSNQANTPQLVGDAFDSRDAQTVSAGIEHTCAIGSLTDSHRAYCWGNGNSGRLGTGDNRDWPIPEPVIQGDAYTDIVTGEEHSCALHRDGPVYCWGENVRNHLGTGSTETSEPRPERILADEDLVFVDIAAGDEHSCALDEHGFVHCWGRFHDGRLGIGTDEDGAYIAAEIPTRIAWPQGEFIPTP